MPDPTAGTATQTLREKILVCLQEHEEEEVLIESLNQLISSTGPETCQILLHVLTSLELDQETAQESWRQILTHRRHLQQAVGREISLRTAICDYFTTVNKSLKNPKVVEIHIFEKTVKDSNYDGLTGLYNRTYFDTALQREVALAERYDTDLSLLFFDIDDFKPINDTHGHEAGDLALKKLAAIIREEKRTSDIAARYGGEEFVVIMPYTSNVDALVLGERIRKKVAALTVDYEGNTFSFTVSGGLASYPVDSKKARSLLKYADTAMYRAKGSGKNNIAFFSQDKRRYLRINYQHPITVKELGFDDSPAITGTSKNICLGGLLFESKEPYIIGKKLQIAVPMNGSSLLVIGTVVRVESFGADRYDIGICISFQEMDKTAKREITRYLTTELQSAS